MNASADTTIPMSVPSTMGGAPAGAKSRTAARAAKPVPIAAQASIAPARREYRPATTGMNKSTAFF